MNGAPARPWWPRALLWALLAMVLASVTVVAIVSRLERRETQAPPILGQVPAFQLTDQGGRPVRREDLAGAPWIADFIFTRCSLSCPLMTARMARLDQELPPRVKLISFSVDPDYDIPEVLAGYAEAHGASERWHFLTGDREEMLSLVRDGFHLGVDLEPPPGTASPEEPIAHSTRFVLVDGQGRIRGYYDLMEPGGLARLGKELAALGR